MGMGLSARQYEIRYGGETTTGTFDSQMTTFAQLSSDINKLVSYLKSSDIDIKTNQKQVYLLAKGSRRDEYYKITVDCSDCAVTKTLEDPFCIENNKILFLPIMRKEAVRYEVRTSSDRDVEKGRGTSYYFTCK